MPPSFRHAAAPRGAARARLAASVRTLLFALAALVAVGAACGNGSSSSGGSSGVDGRVTTAGAVSGFGSFFVAGTEWTLSPTGSVEIDGETGDATGAYGEDDIALGMYLRVDGLRSGDGALGTASTVRLDTGVLGPVDDNPVTLGSGRRRFTVLGQRVTMVSGQTVFSGTSYSSLGEDDVVAVSGPVDSAGEIRATRIRRRGNLSPGSTQVTFQGVVSGLGGGRFDIGDFEVRYSCGASTACSGGAPASGQRVEVAGVYTQSGGPRGRRQTWIQASSIAPASSFADGAANVPNLVLEGVIDDFTGLSGFTVNGIGVNASGATLDPGSPSAFRDGVYVRVEGPTANGVLAARHLVLREGSATVTAQIASGGLDLAEQGVVVLLAEGAQELVVEVDADTRIEDHVFGDDDLDLHELSVGDTVDVHGIALDGERLRATGIDRRDAGPVRLRAPVQEVDRDDTDGSVGYRSLGIFVELVPGTTAVPGDDVRAFLDGVVPGEVLEAGDADDASPQTFDIAEEVGRP